MLPNALLQILILVCLCGLGWWAFTTVLATIPLPAPVRAIFTVIVVVIICAFLWEALGLTHIRGLFR